MYIYIYIYMYIYIYINIEICVEYRRVVLWDRRDFIHSREIAGSKSTTW